MTTRLKDAYRKANGQFVGAELTDEHLDGFWRVLSSGARIPDLPPDLALRLLLRLTRAESPTGDVVPYDPEFGADRECKCGHVYYRHFDGFEDNAPVGCKYCPCYTWEPPEDGYEAWDKPCPHPGRDGKHEASGSADGLFCRACGAKPCEGQLTKMERLQDEGEPDA